MMKTIVSTTLCFAAALATVIAAARLAQADGKKLAVVVAKGSPITNISRSDLKRCFTGDTVTAGDKPLVPFNANPGTPERTGFDKAVLGMSPDEAGKYWIDRKVRGQSGAPRALPSAAHIAKVVAKFPGAISYLPADQLTADIQAVSVDGVVYTDGKYNIVIP
jgi:hypothetical protein